MTQVVFQLLNLNCDTYDLIALFFVNHYYKGILLTQYVFVFMKQFMERSELKASLQEYNRVIPGLKRGSL